MNTDIQRYAQAMPQYEEPLNFVQRILEFQAALAERTESDLRIEAATAREKWQAGQSLFAGEPLSLPTRLFQDALAGLRPLLPPEGPAQATLDRLLSSSFMTPSNIEALLVDLITNTDTCIKGLADATSTDPDTLSFLLRTVLSPFLEKRAAPYLKWVETAGWRHGICPICGSEPWMSRLAQEDGRRILACSLCHTEWAFDRLRCPFCEGDDQSVDKHRTQPQLRYFTVDDDETHRVDCCDRCQRYIKTVDERVSGRESSLLVEDVITSHLDVLVREQGYR